MGGPETDHISAMRKLYLEIQAMMLFGLPDIVICEAPLPGCAQTTEFNNRNANRWMATVELCFGTFKRVPVREVLPKAWRSHFIGSMPQKTQRKTLKEYTQERAAQLGFPRLNEDEADAFGILDYALATEMITPPWRIENVMTRPLGVAA